ncbi:MAG: hypothetical protein RLN88_03045 [Ekhidna sp.]|uniref:hypothetical protein n=1 Tax=Ekhidna sp. TaxID=2608089 RepID=UPI0032ED72B4
MSKVFLWVVLVFVSGAGLAQNTRNAETPKPRQPQYQAAKKEKKSLFSFLKKEKKAELKTAEEEKFAFRKRVNEAYRENAKVEYKARKVKKKEAKKGEKFHGHKRPPKKRPAGKQKFCKICKIKH